MTSVDDMASEIMKGLKEYAGLADTEMKKAVRKTATEVKKEISSNAPKDTGAYSRVAGKPHIAPTEQNGEELLENLIRKALS